MFVCSSLSVCLAWVCPSVGPFVCQYVCLFACLCLSPVVLCLLALLFVCRSVFMYACFSGQCPCLPHFASVCVCVCFSLALSIVVFVCMFPSCLCVSAGLFVRVFVGQMLSLNVTVRFHSQRSSFYFKIANMQHPAMFGALGRLRICLHVRAGNCQHMWC